MKVRHSPANFVAVVGPGTVFPSDGTSHSFADVTDGPENTLIVVEVVNAGIHCMEPKELDYCRNAHPRAGKCGNVKSLDWW